MTPDPRIKSATQSAINDAASVLSAGRLIAFPTETVYGLGADATSDTAVASIFAAKNRPTFNPLIIHVPDIESAKRFVTFNPIAVKLAAEFWPGSLTLVLPRKQDCKISLLVSAGLDTIAIRVPNHPVAHALLKRCDLPIAAPSANRSGEISPTQAAHVAESLNAKNAGPEVILDGGACPVGLESTVIDLSTPTPTLLRPGGISSEQIESAIGPIATAESEQPDAPRSPGMLSRHYAPNVPVRLDVTDVKPGEVILGFGPDAPAQSANLSPTGDLSEAAAHLFAYLRALDAEKPKGIAVMPIPDTGLGRAINDRLRRAATPL